MFCKYCGKELDEEAQFCSFCGKQLVVSSKKDNSLYFYLILFISPILFFLRYSVNNMVHQAGMWQKLITIIVSIIFIVTALYLAKTKKIDSACFEKYDVITWSVFSLALAIFNCYEKISVFNENLLWSVCHTFCGFVREIVMLPTVWYYGCLILFLLIRSGNVKVGRKTIIKIFIALVVWAFLILFLHNEFVWILAPDARVFGITVVSLRLSTYFMWMRYLILLWFAILMGQRKIGFTCGIICSGGTFLVAGIAATLFLDAQMVIECIGLPESIGYIVLGLGVIVSYMVNKKQKN